MGIFKKIKEFYLEHHTVINCIGLGLIGGIGVGVAIGYSRGHDDAMKSMPDLGVWYGKPDNIAKIDVDVDVDKLLGESRTLDVVPKTPEMSNGWDESKYRDGWNKINEFADSITLEDKEMYIVEHNTDYCDEYIVSHLIDGVGVYPPEENEDEDTRETNTPLNEG